MTSTTLMAAAKVNAGPIVLVGIAIIVVAVLAFAFATSWRRKRGTSECAEQQESLASAEQALRYWEAAVAHLREVDLTSGPNQNSVGDGAPANLKYGQTADMTDEQFAELLERAVDGRDGAERYRDQCQVDLVNCIGKPVVGRRATPDSAEPLRPVVDRESTPPRHSEDG